MVTMVSIKYNDEMKVFYDRLKENGKHSTVAQIAVMRKLIIIAHSLYTNKCVYNAQVYQNACGKVELKSNIKEVVA